jgi:hypothetical protein
LLHVFSLPVTEKRNFDIDYREVPATGLPFALIENTGEFTVMQRGGRTPWVPSARDNGSQLFDSLDTRKLARSDCRVALPAVVGSGDAASTPDK